MPLEILARASAESAGLVSDRRLYVASDGKLMVEDGDHRAAILLATPGWVIPARQAELLRLSVKDGRIVQGDAADAAMTVVVDESAEVAPKAEKIKRRKGE